MKKIFGRFWLLAISVWGTMFAYCLSIYLFDIHVAKGGVKKAIIAPFVNEESDVRYYAIDTDYGFEVDFERSESLAVMYFSKYDVNAFPLCLTCGWHAHREGLMIWTPHLIGDILYTTDPKDRLTMNEHIPMDAYATFNLKTKEEGYVLDLNEIAPDAENEDYRVTRDFVESNYREISYLGYDDEDCIEAFISIYAAFFVLLVWGIIAWVIYKIRKAKGLVD